MPRPLFHADGSRRDLGVFASIEEPSKLFAVECFFPALVRFPFISALPLDVSLVAKSARKITEKLLTRPFRS